VYPGMYLPHGKYDWVPSPRAWQICLQDGWAKRVHAIAVEENAAVLVEADGHAKIVGFGPAFFLEAAARPKICADGEPLTFANVSVHKGETGTTFDFCEWKSEGGSNYSLSVSAGKVSSDAPSHFHGVIPHNSFHDPRSE